MKEAHDHKCVTPQGRAVGEQLVRLIEPAIAKVAAEGEPDERCRSCAFRAGTVPNGCPQTMADVIKCVVEQKPFYCHVDKYADGSDKICHGWFAARWVTGDRPPGQVPWDFSPPDDYLPEGLFMRDGKFFATCHACDRDTEILCDIREIPATDYRHYCGGSPRCCP